MTTYDLMQSTKERVDIAIRLTKKNEKCKYIVQPLKS